MSSGKGDQIFCLGLWQCFYSHNVLTWLCFVWAIFFYLVTFHDDVIKWKHFPRYWPFVRGIHRSPVNSLHKGQWRGALIFTLMCSRINGWVNNREAGDLRRHRAHYDVTVMIMEISPIFIRHSLLELALGRFYDYHWTSEFKLKTMDKIDIYLTKTQ